MPTKRCYRSTPGNRAAKMMATTMSAMQRATFDSSVIESILGLTDQIWGMNSGFLGELKPRVWSTPSKPQPHKPH
jgi:hypothetical protein